MVRDGGDRDDPDRITTTVVLHVGDDATRSDELDRAVEVAASILSAAADESRAAVSGAYRLVMADLDTGSQRGRDSLQNVLIALAGVAVASTASSPRLGALLEGLGQPDRDEALVIVGAFGKHLPEGEVLAELARAYSTVVLVAVGAASAPTAVGVLTVALPLGRSLAAAWSPDLEGQAPFDDVSGLEVRAAGVAR